MFVKIQKSVLIIGIVLFAQASVAAQQTKPRETEIRARKKNVAVIVVGQTAKASWKTASFVATEIARPIGKELLIPMVKRVAVPFVFETMPRAAMFTAAQTTKAMEKAIPLGANLLVKCLKLRLAP